MFSLKKLNVVRIVATEEEKDKLLNAGFEEVEEAESKEDSEDPEGSSEIDPENPDKKAKGGK